MGVVRGGALLLDVHVSRRPVGQPGMLAVTGFTLVEVLLALLMFAMIAGVIFSAFGAVVKGVEKGRQSMDIYPIGRTALQRMAQEISTAMQFPDDLQTTLEGKDGTGDGLARDRITFATVPYRAFTRDVPESDLCDVSYFIAPNTLGRLALYRRENCTGDEDREAGDHLELTDTAVALNIVYFDADGEPHNDWPPSGGQSVLPCRVFLELTLQGEQQYGRVFATVVPLIFGQCSQPAAEKT